MKSCIFCQNPVYSNGICKTHIEALQKMKEGRASPRLQELYSSQESEECYVPASKYILFGYNNTTVLKLVMYINNKFLTNEIERTCGTKDCCNFKHLKEGSNRQPSQDTLLFREHKQAIDKLIRDTSVEFHCIPGFTVESKGKHWTYFENRKVLLGTALLNYHTGISSGSAIRLCQTPNCYNQRHYKRGSKREEEEIRRKRLKVEQPTIPPELEWEVWKAYLNLKDEDVAPTIILGTLAKIFNVTASKIQSIIIWSRFR